MARAVGERASAFASGRHTDTAFVDLLNHGQLALSKDGNFGQEVGHVMGLYT